jgi:hypothetical protein
MTLRRISCFAEDAISLAAGAATAKYGENPPKEDFVWIR